jgi:hypothetical protein
VTSKKSIKGEESLTDSFVSCLPVELHFQQNIHFLGSIVNDYDVSNGSMTFKLRVKVSRGEESLLFSLLRRLHKHLRVTKNAQVILSCIA